EFDHGLIENEIDHVYFGFFEGTPNPNKDEVSEWKWVNIEELYVDIDKNPQHYTYWFKHIVKNYRHEIFSFCCK
ncbi:MAG TPA: NUDIX domain-containing protein, partial [Tenuifilaceae bacterium]|nr:NUDIX domain-containing protein [Tenuifilaceae bacterium]